MIHIYISELYIQYKTMRIKEISEQKNGEPAHGNSIKVRRLTRY